jgi:hypothetical protein
MQMEAVPTEGTAAISMSRDFHPEVGIEVVGQDALGDGRVLKSEFK